MNSTPDDLSVELPAVSDDVVAVPEAVAAEAVETADEPAAVETADERARPADEQLLAAHDQARAALIEITPELTIGDPAGYSLERDGVVSLRFENLLTGYPGWFWTVSLARLEDAEPTVLEVELLPGDGALLAPDWVPWAVRLADYQAAQVAIAEANAAAGILDDGLDVDDLDEELDDSDDELEDDELGDLEDLDAGDFADDGSRVLHAGDVDGVDIDELDVDELDDDSDDEDSDFSDDDEGSREY